MAQYLKATNKITKQVSYINLDLVQDFGVNENKIGVYFNISLNHGMSFMRSEYDLEIVDKIEI